MNADKEKTKVIMEWRQRAIDDLESAEIILRESDNYEIAAYHAHQAIEKALKAELLERGETFKFIHDLNALFRQVFKTGIDQELLDKVLAVDALYPILRYPTGDKITQEQAQRTVEVAKLVLGLFKMD